MTHSFWYCYLEVLKVLATILGISITFGGLFMLHIWSFEEDKWFRWFLPPIDFVVITVSLALACQHGVK